MVEQTIIGVGVVGDDSDGDVDFGGGGIVAAALGRWFVCVCVCVDVDVNVDVDGVVIGGVARLKGVDLESVPKRESGRVCCWGCIVDVFRVTLIFYMPIIHRNFTAYLAPIEAQK